MFAEAGLLLAGIAGALVVIFAVFCAVFAGGWMLLGGLKLIVVDGWWNGWREDMWAGVWLCLFGGGILYGLALAAVYVRGIQ